MAIGLSGIAFNKYPGKQISYASAKKRYPTAKERRVTLFDGLFCIIFGVVYMLPGGLVLFLLAGVLMGYYPIKLILLRFELI
jgi:hypothetical protein